MAKTSSTKSLPAYDNEVKVRRGRVASVDLYEIKDSELDILEAGTPATLQLNFAIFLFSTAFTSIGALATASFVSETIKTIFLLVSIVGIMLGGYLFIAWVRGKKSVRIVIKNIRARMIVANETESNITLGKQNSDNMLDDSSPK